MIDTTIASPSKPNRAIRLLVWTCCIILDNVIYRNYKMSKSPDSRPRGIYLLPNLFTIAALFSGFYAVVAAMQHHYDVAAIAIFVAMLFDGLDGRVARMTDTQTPFGAEFDSLSDMVSFGMAPSLVLYTWSLHYLGKPGWLAAFIYCACSALRLARFNTVTVPDKRYFQGLSTTAAAGFVAGVVWVCDSYGLSGHSLSYLIFALAVGVGALKVSRIPYRSFKDLDLRDKVPFVVIVVLVMIFVLVVMDPPDLLLLVFGAYAVSGPAGYLVQFVTKRKRKAKAAGHSHDDDSET